MPKQQNQKTRQEQAQWLRAMAHPVRLTILESLCDEPRCVKNINSLISIGQPQLSQHIAALRKAKLIDCHVSGSLRCYYIIRPTLVKKIMRVLSQDHPLRPRDRRSVMRIVNRRQTETEIATTDRRPSPARRNPDHKQAVHAHEKGRN